MAKYPEQIPPKLREAADANHNLGKLAEAAGVGHTTLWKNASGLTRMSWPTAAKISAVYPKYTTAEFVAEHHDDEVAAHG